MLLHGPMLTHYCGGSFNSCAVSLKTKAVYEQLLTTVVKDI